MRNRFLTISAKELKEKLAASLYVAEAITSESYHCIGCPLNAIAIKNIIQLSKDT